MIYIIPFIIGFIFILIGMFNFSKYYIIEKTIYEKPTYEVRATFISIDKKNEEIKDAWTLFDSTIYKVRVPKSCVTTFKNYVSSDAKELVKQMERSQGRGL